MLSDVLGLAVHPVRSRKFIFLTDVDDYHGGTDEILTKAHS
jgi:hypothetical protein